MCVCVLTRMAQTINAIVMVHVRTYWWTLITNWKLCRFDVDSCYRKTMKSSFMNQPYTAWDDFSLITALFYQLSVTAHMRRLFVLAFVTFAFYPATALHVKHGLAVDILLVCPSVCLSHSLSTPWQFKISKYTPRYTIEGCYFSFSKVFWSQLRNPEFRDAPH